MYTSHHPRRSPLLCLMAFITAPLLARAFIQTKPEARQICPFRPSIKRTPCTKMSSDMPATDAPAVGKIPKGMDPKTMTDEDWRSVLSAQEYNVLRDKGTEYPGTGIYDGYYPKEGHFACVACGNPIYSAESKFKSGCGWPAFDKCYKDSIAVKKDFTFGMTRVEIMCAKCGGHLGHVFEGERFTKTNERHCVNSVSVKYVKDAVKREQTKILGN